MIRGERLSTSPIAGLYLYPDDIPPQMMAEDQSSLEASFDATPSDWEMGGIALNNPIRGLMYQAWVFRVEGTDLVVEPQRVGTKTVLFSGLSNVTELSGSFDGNMQPVVAYVENGTTKLYWFDAQVPGYRTTAFPDAINPRLTLDDKRVAQLSNADVLFFYLRNNGLYYRQQRDKYAVERFLGTCPPNTLRLGRVGMATTSRVQIEFLTGG